MLDTSGKRPHTRRLGFGKACYTCRQKKHRCDGHRPVCFSCQNRGLQCKYADDVILPLLESSDGFACASHTQGHTNGRIPEFLEPTQGGERIQRGAEGDHGLKSNERSIGHSQAGAHQEGGDTSARRDSFVSSRVEILEPNSYYGDSSTLRFLSKVRPELQSTQESTKSHEITACLNGPAIPTTSAWSPTLEDGWRGHHELPPQQVANELIDAYFERVHVLYPFLHEGSFRARYEHSWTNQDLSAPSEVSWQALISIVLAYGCEFCPTSQTDEWGKRASAFIERAKSIILFLVFKRTDLTLVQALLLLCHHMQGSLASTECYNLAGLMMRNAINIGLHVDPTNDENVLPVEKESRKRLWWGCVVLDRTLCMKLGRPPSIRPTDAHRVGLPSEVDDQYIVDTSPIPRQPLGRPSRTSFFVQTIKLSHIIDGILTKLYLANSEGQKREESQTSSPRGTDEASLISNAFLLDGQLQVWWDEMPRCLKEEPDLPDGTDFQRQRHVMRIRYLQIRLLLQRPVFLLLSKGQINDDFIRAGAIACSRICLSTAEETIQLIHRDYNRQLLNSLWYNVHYVFTSLALLITVQIMETSLHTPLSPVPSRAVFDRGIEFLRAVSSKSTLASYYVTLLDQLRSVPNGGVNNEVEQDMAIRHPTELLLDQQACVPPPDPNLFGLREDIDIDFSAIDSFNSLFETGIPLPTMDWAYLNGSF